MTALPLVGSSPIESRPTFGRSTPITSRMNCDPMIPNWSRFSARASELAPESIRRQGPPWAGSGTPIPGREMPRMRPMWSSEAASIAPVGPADTTASAEPSRTSRQAVTIELPGLARTAAAGSSLEPITSAASTISMPSAPPSSAASCSRSPQIRMRTPSAAASSAPATIPAGA